MHHQRQETKRTFIAIVWLLLALIVMVWVNGSGAIEATGTVVNSDETPEVPQAVLHSQLDLVLSSGMTSQNFEPTSDTLDSQAADDFVIPSEDAPWFIQQIELRGRYAPGPVSTGPVESVNVYFYSNANNQPDALVFSQQNIIPVQGAVSGNFVLDLNPTAVLQSGSYWVSVQANMNSSAGEWRWRLREEANWNDGVWRNPNNGSGMNCLNWTVVANCSTFSQPDFGFELRGVLPIGSINMPMVFRHLPDGEDNDACGDAYLINVNRDYFFLPDDQTDWYHFYLNESTNLSIEITNYTPIEGQLAVYKDLGGGCDDRQLLGNDGTPGLSRVVSVGSQSPGHYYIFVGNDGTLSNTNPYQLRINFP